MLPDFNYHLHNPNNQPQFNGADPSAPYMVNGSQGNMGPMNTQFQAGVLNNPQLSMPPFTNSSPFIAPNQLFPFSQGAFQNLNANNLPQPFAQNAVNPTQMLPNWFMNVPNLVQNACQLLQMQMMNNIGCQDLGLFMNAQTGVRRSNGVLPQPVNGNGLTQMNPHNALPKDFGSLHAQRNWDIFSPSAAESQSNAGVVNDVIDRKNNRRKSHDNNEAQRGFGNKQFQHHQNVRGNFKINNENRGRGNKSLGGKYINLSNTSEEIQGGKKRSLVLNYTEQEILHWREERRKHYPSQANLEKKWKKDTKQLEVADDVAKIRRQQLKEILAKQAELGCEVAEIPSCYLLDPEQQRDGAKQNNKVLGKRDRFYSKVDKKGKFQHGHQFSKSQRYENNRAGCATNLLHSEPSLLKKLLSSDLKKDKKHLLQVFRFLVVNKFLENWPAKPLKFPQVIFKESGDESEIIKQKPEEIEGDNSYDILTHIFRVQADGHVKNVDILTAKYADAEEGEIL